MFKMVFSFLQIGSQMIKLKTGHYVVRPLINGRDAGFFIVDTGTGTLAITQRMVLRTSLLFGCF
jgi:predicted aspartyl protease